MKSCSEINELISLYIDGLLENDLKSDFEEHLKTCEHCKEELEETLKIIEICGSMEEEELPHNFKEDLHARLVELEEMKTNRNDIIKRLNIFVKVASGFAAVLIFAVVYFGGFPFGEQKTSNDPERRQAAISSIAVAPNAPAADGGNSGVVIANNQKRTDYTLDNDTAKINAIQSVPKDAWQINNGNETKLSLDVGGQKESADQKSIPETGVTFGEPAGLSTPSYSAAPTQEAIIVASVNENDKNLDTIKFKKAEGADTAGQNQKQLTVDFAYGDTTALSAASVQKFMKKSIQITVRMSITNENIDFIKQQANVSVGGVWQDNKEVPKENYSIDKLPFQIRVQNEYYNHFTDVLKSKFGEENVSFSNVSIVDVTDQLTGLENEIAMLYQKISELESKGISHEKELNDIRAACEIKKSEAEKLRMDTSAYEISMVAEKK
ncbi:MAG: anti-sigma factor [Clostridia bacterium]|nr:anti-sigma factor [Clostridia bacterium]